jgi:photosystem II stability/assembly factor-like uncharacterized protein
MCHPCHRLAALALVVACASLAGPTSMAADSGPEWYYVGTNAAEAGPRQQPSIPFAPASPLAHDPLVGVLTQFRDCPMYYRFAVPPGSYRVRLHYLAADRDNWQYHSALVAKANGTVIVADTLWRPITPAMGGDQTAIPPEVVAREKEIEVAAPDGELRVTFPYVKSRHFWGVSGIEVLGDKLTLRVRCGSSEPYTDGHGDRWEPDAGHWRALPTAGAVDIPDIDRTRGQWTNVSDGLFKAMGEAFGLQPLPRPWLKWRVVADRAGDVVFCLTGIGMWRYDWTAGRAERVDGGAYSGDPKMAAVGNPAGPGIWASADGGLDDGIGAWSDDGRRWTPTHGGGGAIAMSVDWTAKPPVMWLRVHDTGGNTNITVDGGRSFRGADGQADIHYSNIADFAAVGGGVLLRIGNQGALLRSTDLGATWTPLPEPTVPASSPAFIQRLDDVVIMHTGTGESFVSTDLGATWSAGARTPGFAWPMAHGRKDRQLIGFTRTEAYESFDLGATWTKVLEHGLASRSDVFSEDPWGYDAALDAFYYIEPNGDIMRYAR